MSEIESAEICVERIENILRAPQRARRTPEDVIRERDAAIAAKARRKAIKEAAQVITKQCVGWVPNASLVRWGKGYAHGLELAASILREMIEEPRDE